MIWVLLGLAIAAEMIGTLALRASEGFSRLAPSLLVVAGYGTAFFLLSLVLREIKVGLAYAIWAGLGTVGVAIAAWLVFGERLSPVAVAGIALVVAGVVLINIGSSAHG